MKQIILACMIIVFAACNNPKKYSGDSTLTDSIINSSGAVIDSVNREGARLIAANDCFTCHRIEQKLRGPSYKEIALKYHFS